MIQFIFGGQKNNTSFEAWLRSTNFVYRFNPLDPGELARFARAIVGSLESIAHIDYYGNEIRRVTANDPMVVVIDQATLNELEHGREAWSKIRAFFQLAQDADLEVAVTVYGDDDAVRGWADRLSVG